MDAPAPSVIIGFLLFMSFLHLLFPHEGQTHKEHIVNVLKGIRTSHQLPPISSTKPVEEND